MRILATLRSGVRPRLPLVRNMVPRSYSKPVPSRLERYVPRLASLAARTGVPLPSLVVSFAILHELTAIVPVVLLYYIFQSLGAGASVMAWLVGNGGHDDKEKADTTWTRTVADWYEEGARKVERVGHHYGILGYDKVDKSGQQSTTTSSVEESGAAEMVANAIAAYVVVKALVPVRIAVSIAGAPAFARVALAPFKRAFAALRQSK